MAVKFLIVMALLQMGACVPAPEPDPHNIDIQISQEVNSGCCNGVCPCGHIWDCCLFDNKIYPNGYIIREEECLTVQCIDGNWNVEITPECGNCTFGGEPLVYTFDTLGPSQPISVVGLGEHRMADHRMAYPGPDFGVNGHFTDEEAGGRVCGGPGYTNCIDGAIYYEKKANGRDYIAVKLTIAYDHSSHKPTIRVFTLTTKELWSGSWGSHQVFNSGKSFGTVDVFKGLLSIPGFPGAGSACTIVIGSKGLTVALCETVTFEQSGYPWAYINAMPNVLKPLDGICNDWTGEDKEYFTAENGERMYYWQNGTCMYDRETGTCVVGAPGPGTPSSQIISRLRNDLVGGFWVGP